MATLIPVNLETVSPSAADALLARESSRLLADHKLGHRTSVRIRLVDDGDDAETLSVPTSAVRLFLHLLTEMSQGNAVTLIPTHAELTTQQAADLLNVSRPYMAKLLDEGKIPGRTVGKYRRVRFDDLVEAVNDEFKENEDLPNTTNPDDWARISGRKGERIIKANINAFRMGTAASQFAAALSAAGVPSSVLARLLPRLAFEPQAVARPTLDAWCKRLLAADAAQLALQLSQSDAVLALDVVPA